MKSLVSIIGLAVVVTFAAAAFAEETAPQPLTRAACDQAGMQWDDEGNVCADEKRPSKEKHGHGKDKHGHDKDEMGAAAEAAPQPLTKTDCDAAGMKWSERANVCGKDKHDKKKYGKKKHGHEHKKHRHGKKHKSH